MKFIFTSDLHFHHFTEFDRLMSDGTFLRLNLYIETFKYLTEYCKENNINHWFDLGDIFHSRESISTEVLDVLAQCLEIVKAAGINMYFITGNHDQGNKSGEISTNRILSAYGKVFDRFEVQLIGNVEFYIYPWSTEPVKYNAMKFSSYKEKKKIILGHRMIKGAKHLGVMLDGEDFDATDYDWAFFGHIHQLQNITAKAFYIGSTIANNFGERDSEHGFEVYDSDTNTISFIENPHSPKFEQVEMTQKEFETFCESPFSLKPTTFREIKIILDENSSLVLPENMQNIRITKVYPQKTESRLEKNDNLTPEYLIDELTKIDKLSEERKNIGLEILKKCK